MIPAFAPRPSTRDHNIVEQPGRTRAHPTEECCHVLRTYCVADKELSPNGIRIIGTAVTKLSECKLLHMVDEELIERYLGIQHFELSKPSPIFPFDMVEISLKFLAASDMSIRLYRDEYLRLIVEKLHSLCVTSLFEQSEFSDQLYRLGPLLRHFAHIVEQCAFPDPSLIDLCSIGIKAYFLASSSPSLQSGCCSLLTGVFRRYQPFRIYIIDEVFSILPKSQGSSKFLSFSKGGRISISGTSRLFLELVQSICSFPMDVESIVKELIRIIIERFFKDSKTSTIIAKSFEKFTEDVGKCLTHPFYPIASLFLKSLLEFFFPLVTKKDRLSRLAIKMLCPTLDVITSCFHQSKEEVAIAVPLSLLQSLADFDDERIRNLMELPDSHFLIDNESIVMKIDCTFPSNKLEKLTSNLIICLYIRQCFKLSDLINTSLPYHIANWSTEELSQEEMDNYLVWWRGTFPDTIDFEWTIDIAERLCLNQITKQLMFQNVQLLIQRLLRGLENINASLRSCVLRGFSAIIQNEPDLLYHPLLVRELESAFTDPCVSVREAVLTIIAGYVNKNDQISSPYFPVVVNCLSDSSPVVVKSALGAVRDLAKTATDEELSHLCVLLTQKLEDPSEKVRNPAKATFLASIFEYSKSPFAVLLSVIANQHSRPTWFSSVFKEAYLHNSEQFKVLIGELVESVCVTPTVANTALLLEFSELLPGACLIYHPQLISCFNSCQDGSILISLSTALTALVRRITTPNLSLFGMMLKPMEMMICSQRASVVRPVVELFATTIRFIFPESTILDSLQMQFMTFLRQNIVNIPKLQNESESLVGQICRSLFTSGCIFRFYGAKNQTIFGNSLWGPVNHFFKCPIQRVRSMVLHCACDICARDPGFIEKAKALVSIAFDLGPPQSIAALTFLANLTEQESQGEDTTAIDEIRPMYSSNLLQLYLPQIVGSFHAADSSIRTESLRLSRIALSHGMINPHAIVPHIIALLCSPEECKLAAQVISEAVNNYSFAGAVSSRLSDGLKDSFAFVQSAQISDGTQGLSELYKLLPVAMQKDLLTVIVSKVEESLTQPTDPDWILWLMQSLINIEFGQTAEPAFLVKSLSQGSVHTYLRMVAKDAKEILFALGNKSEIDVNAAGPRSWYAAVLIARTKQWIMKRYQIELKKLDKLVKNGNSVKIAKIKPLDLTIIPKPEQIGLTDGILDLGANLLSVMRMERSIDPSE